MPSWSSSTARRLAASSCPILTTASWSTSASRGARSVSRRLEGFGGAEAFVAVSSRPFGRDFHDNGLEGADLTGDVSCLEPYEDSHPLFERFANLMRRYEPAGMPKRTDIHSIIVLGAGPIVIGQACEFDYSGAQACKALKAKGYRVILVNSNPATIMTDPELADATYIEPLTAEVVERIIEKEQPEALLPALGSQTALNLAMELAAKVCSSAIASK